jgi:hypothetical protein
MMKKNIYLIAALAIVLGGCYYDSEDVLYPSGPCSTADVTYSNTVLPALQSNGCIGCHTGSAPSGNISLDSYANVKAQALNGKLYGSINFMAGYSAMPKGGSKMNNCTISKIKAWVDAGALNN